MNQPEVIADRALALVSCPAQAPDPWAGADDHDTAIGERHQLDRILQLVSSGFESLPDEQRGQLWLDLQRSRVVVQVTHDADAVLAELRARVEDPNSVAVELVRYARSQLERWAQMIMNMDDIGWTSVGFENPNNRVEVQVSGSADQAWRRIADVVESCAFRVEGGIVVMPLSRRDRSEQSLTALAQAAARPVVRPGDVRPQEQK